MLKSVEGQIPFLAVCPSLSFVCFLFCFVLFGFCLCDKIFGIFKVCQQKINKK